MKNIIKASLSKLWRPELIASQMIFPCKPLLRADSESACKKVQAGSGMTDMLGIQCYDSFSAPKANGVAIGGQSLAQTPRPQMQCSATVQQPTVISRPESQTWQGPFGVESKWGVPTPSACNSDFSAEL